jgi:acylphosphatase
MATVAVRAVVRGRVQGVGFRYATHARARRLGVSGWVRNLATGDVEVFAQGEPNNVDALVGWLGTGPRSAIVHAVERHPAPVDLSLRSFMIR